MWDNYGGRGITMSDEFINSFQTFIEHVGPKPSPDLSLDRIDNSRGYERGNLRWATRSEQAQNRRGKRPYKRRNSTRLTHNGKTQTVDDWAAELGIPASRIRERLRNGHSHEWALFTGNINKENKHSPAFGKNRRGGENWVHL